MKDVDPRFKFAAERTMLAWLRTGLALMGFGFVVARFTVVGKNDNNTKSLLVGIFLTLIGVSVVMLSEINYRRSIKRMQNEESVVDSEWGLARILAIVLSLTGLAMAYYLYFER